MAVYFIDSSALVKRYLSETGSVRIVGLFNPGLNNEIFIAAITSVEIIAAVIRRSRSGGIRAVDAAMVCEQLRTDLQAEYQVIETTEGIINSAMALAETQGLRGYDAVQLAAGCAVNALCTTSGLPPAIFVSADSALNTAAARAGLVVENPNSYL